MRLAARAVLGAAAIAAVLLSGSAPASAVCAAVDDEPARTPDLVFSGTVLSRTETEVTITIDAVYKGDAFHTETLPATGFADDPLVSAGVGAHTVVQGLRNPLTGEITVPSCTRWDSSSWSEANAHPPATGVLGRLRTHPVSGLTVVPLILLLALIIAARVATNRCGSRHPKSDQATAPLTP